MSLRPATADDVPAVLALDREVFGPDAWSEESVREELTGPRRVAVVACDPDLIGYAVTMTANRVVDLQRIVVRPERRRRGLAHELFAAVTDQADADRMLLEVSAANEGAVAFYTSVRFSAIHRRPRYYEDGSDAIVMERDLP